MDSALTTPSVDFSRAGLKSLLALAVPTTCQMSSYTLMQFLDTFLLAKVGSIDVAAGSNGGMVAFCCLALGFGTLNLVNTVVSQARGRGDDRAAAVFAWQGFWLAAVYGLLVIPLFLVAEAPFRWAGHESRLVALEGLYLAIVIPTTLPKALSHAAGRYLLALGRSDLLLWASAVGMGVNAVVALPLIPGWFGAPCLGVFGAAVAVVAGVTVECGLLLWFASRGEAGRILRLSSPLPRLREMRELLALGLPAGAQVLCDIAAWSIFLVAIVGKLGTDAMAANALMFRYMSVSFMPAIGVQSAVTTLVGYAVGMRRADLVRAQTYLALKVVAVYMVSMGIFFVFGRHMLVEAFTDEPEVVRIAVVLMIFSGVYQFFDSLYIIFAGALMGAGDTLVPSLVSVGLFWTLLVPGGIFMANKFPQWGVGGPWTAATLFGIALGVFMWLRFRHGGWARRMAAC